MLFAVVSLKWSRPTVTFVTCSEGRVTLEATQSQISTAVYSVSVSFSWCLHEYSTLLFLLTIKSHLNALLVKIQRFHAWQNLLCNNYATAAPSSSSVHMKLAAKMSQLPDTENSFGLLGIGLQAHITNTVRLWPNWPNYTLKQLCLCLLIFYSLVYDQSSSLAW